MPGFFEKFIMHQNGLESGKAVDVTSENVHYFDFWAPVCTPLIPCHYH